MVTRRTVKIIVFILTIAVSAIVLATLAALYLVRRDVNFTLTDPHVNGKLTPESLAAGVPVTVTVLVRNRNFFPIRLERVEAIGTHPLYSGPLATSSLTGIDLRRRGDTNFTIPFLLKYNPAMDATGAYIAALIENCTKRAPLYADATLTADYDTWVKDGTINEARQLNIECPV